VAAAVGPGADDRVGHGIEDAADGADDADNRESEQHGALLDEDFLAHVQRLLRRLVEVDEPVDDDAGEHAPAELADGKEPEHFVGDLFHISFPLFILNMQRSYP